MIQWLVAGVGDIATRRVLPAILAEPRSRLRAVVTSHPSKAAAMGVPGYSTLEEGLADPLVNALYVATPVALHHPSVLAALRAGKHVLCEKPAAMNYQQAQEMAAAAEASGLVCAVAYYRRLYPKIVEAKRLMEAGAIGKPVLAELNCHSWFNPIDGHRAWLVERNLAGGGPLYDIASHRIDLLHFLFGRPERATGFVSKAVQKYEVEDNATVVVDFAEGVRGVVDVRWHSRVDRDQCRIVGTDGALDLDPLNGPELRTPAGTLHLPPHANLHYPIVEDFVAAVLDGEKPACPIVEAIQTDWVTSQIR
ncbi:MAG: Gfo/Idh/MocA family oxidoreductase [Acidobacteria bacterium]|nr:Gfo/Idh/MocA family oxidoreductase [Acidobacteriota bacterium]